MRLKPGYDWPAIERVLWSMQYGMAWSCIAVAAYHLRGVRL